MNAGEVLTITVNGATYTVVPNASGIWSVDTQVAIPTSGTLGIFTNGTTYSVTAIVTDAATNSATDVTSNELIIDTTPPTAPTVVSQTTNDTTPVITGTTGTGAALNAGETLTVTVNGATYTVVPNASGIWSVDTQVATPTSGTLGTFTNGTTYSVTATITDAATNSTSDATSNELVIDTTAPTAPTVVSQTTNDTTPIITGTTGTGAALNAGEVLTVTVNGATYTVVPNTSGIWSVDTQVAIPTSGTLGIFTNGTTYSVTATVTDAATNSTSDGSANELTIITLTNPPVASDATLTLNENSTVGTLVHTVTASDSDPGDVLVYAIITGNTGNTFTINPATGAITIINAATIDFETNPVFVLTVTVTDSQGHITTITVTINLVDSDNEDTDGDSVLDFDEKGTNPGTPRDTDGDGTPDFRDTDDDNDGIPTTEEDGDNDGNLLNDDCDNDTIMDYLDADQCKVKPTLGFSPDGDGQNETWFINFIEHYPGNDVKIFNRWGNEVYHVKGYNNVDRSWGGQSNGRWLLESNGQVPDGTYFYVIDLGDGSKAIGGFIILKR